MDAKVGVSLGTAGLLRLRKLHSQVEPTTAYLLVGGRCERNCAFCAQARESRARADALSRITWPSFDPEETAEAIVGAYRSGKLARCCMQVTFEPTSFDRVLEMAHLLAPRVPLSASIVATDLGQVDRLLRAGLDRVGLSVDAASPTLYRRIKGGDWAECLALIREASRLFPGCISTHLIVGLGETEKEMVSLIQKMHAWGVTIGLFAFTPIAGTAMEDYPPPPIGTYRRVQIAYYLIKRGLASVDQFAFSSEGRIIGFGFSQVAVEELVASGDAFCTSGCPGCNRPYYNERPGGVIYNFPRPLTPREAEQAVKEAWIYNEEY